MDIKDLLNIGIGRCGNNLVDEIIKQDKRFAGLLINSAKNDVVILDSYKNERASVFLFNNTDGSGMNRTVADRYAKNNIQRFADEMSNYSSFKLFSFYFSTDGGTGSGSAPRLIEATRRLYPNVPIMVYAVLPKLPNTKIALDNSLDCIDDIMRLYEERDRFGNRYINSIRFIDNNKRDTFDEINFEAVTDIIETFKINKYNINGVTDSEDSYRVLSQDGYGITLRLNNNISEIDEAILNAKENSVFVMPEDDYCGSAMFMLQSGRYSFEEAKKIFSPTLYSYEADSNGKNTIIATGMSMPTRMIDDIEEALEEINLEIKMREENRSTYTPRRKREKSTESFQIQISNISEKDLDRLFGDDDFWS